MLDLNIPLIPLSLGVLPAILWLLFWLTEDKKNPEPQGVIMLTFMGGILIAPIIIVLQRIPKQFLNLDIEYLKYFATGAGFFIIVSITEELYKYFAAYFFALKRKANDEPLDPVIYMITAALGFAAIENSLYLLSGFNQGIDFYSLILQGNFRFIGSTLLHVVSSATVGVFMSLAFYKSAKMKKLFLAIGLLLAIVLHTIFNLLIINSDNANIFTIFTFVWISVIVLLLMFEEIKTIKPFKKNKK